MVFKRLFGRKEEIAPRIWSAPEGQRIYAIGDIHGRLDLIDQLILQIEQDNASRNRVRTQIIFLGDLCDRGPNSRGVIERVMQLASASSDVRLIAGNHEELLIRAWEGDRRSVGLINRVGGRETMLSYGVDEVKYDEADTDELLEMLVTHIPESHIAFLKGADDWIVAGDYLFVHAGIRPGDAIEEQRTSDLRWIRREFTDFEGSHGMMVVHGHTITEDVEERVNRIGIDTGAYASGKLTALGLEGEERWFLQT
ncbi:MAG: serine/threonine protein phosphatase [Sphingomonadales bacterium]|jgi:serine/threonine protein phosphatase 1|nr:serine/threonine protein phosphatase [Sphingomonadales bacterium]MBK6719915.1 serine/threonine protein phosphatase [Sphingomonadales bacterium]MBK8271660.1 serine/threonine protein phosphatase [Sphingomonadales bacterium]MBK8861454.1 serine/threonine protein phosphatase [Sphingomonadales bacterium]